VRFGAETCDLIDRLLTCNPGERITATQALEHDYFWTDPLPADPKTCCSFRFSSSSFPAHILSSLRLPVYEASHEFDKRGRRQQPLQAPIAPPHPTEPPPPTMNNLPLYLHRGHPTRDSFRAPPVPLPARPGVPPPGGHQHPYPQPPDYRNGVPMNLPPIHYPAQGPPPAPYQLPNVPPPPQQPVTWDHKPRISHLPPRPSMPTGIDRFGDSRFRGGGRDSNHCVRGERDRDRDHGGLNYG
jgi:serine/threonine-protein kinase BUR1